MSNLTKRFPRYTRLLRLYPSAYRRQYAEPTLQTLADMLDNPTTNKSAVWLKVAADLPLSLARQQFAYLGDVMTHDTPSYVKRSAAIGALLVTPFFVFVIGDALSNHRLYDSLFWQIDILFTWIIVLPSLAILINLVAFATWAVERRRTRHTSWWQAVTDFQHNWPLITVMVIGLGILAIVFGHDSVYCIGGNPFQELANWHQTWTCIEQR